MNISQEKPEELVLKVSIELSPDDYQPNVQEALGALRKKVNMPGFRPGKVPAGLVNKMYAASVRAEEVEKLAINQLFAYLKENEIEYLAEPIPDQNNTSDFSSNGLFSLSYEVGLVPEVAINMPQNHPLQRLVVLVDEALIEEEIEALRRHHGQTIFPETAEIDDMVGGEMTFLQKPEDPDSRNFQTGIFIPLNRLAREEDKALFLGKTKGDSLTLNPHHLFEDKSEASRFLATEEADFDQLPNEISFKIVHISRIIEAEINQEFFDAAFGETQITSLDEAKERIRIYFQSMVQPSLDTRLLGEIRELLIDSNPIPLPESFLKRWLRLKEIKKSSDSDLDTEERVNQLFQNDQYALRWQLIRTQIEKQYLIQISQEEVDQEAEANVRERLRKMGYALPEDQVQTIVERFKSNREEMEDIYLNLLEFDVLQKIKEELDIPEHQISWAEAQGLLQNT